MDYLVTTANHLPLSTFLSLHHLPTQTLTPGPFKLHPYISSSSEPLYHAMSTASSFYFYCIIIPPIAHLYKSTQYLKTAESQQKRCFLSVDSHLLEVHGGVFRPVYEANAASWPYHGCGVVVLREGQKQCQHPDDRHHHTGLGGC